MVFGAMRLLALTLLFWLPPNGAAPPERIAWDVCAFVLQQDDWRCD